MKGFFSYKITGLNLDFLIEKLKKGGIPLYLLKKEDKKTLIITTSAKTEKKLFAITKGLCYNIIKIGESGVFNLKEFFVKRLSLIIFASLFLFSTFLFRNFVVKIEVFGTGYSKREEIKRVLEENGVKEFSFFTADTKTIETKILKTGDFSFCSVEKKGNRLKINALLTKKEVVKEKSYALFSNTDGKIISLKVFKGTAVKKVGDFVNKGEEIVLGYELINEEKKEVFVLAEVKIETENKAEFIFTKEVEEELILEILKEEFAEDLVIERINFTKTDDKYEYTVEFKSYFTLSVGG